MRIGSIVVNCVDFDRMLAFWREALRYVPREPVSDGWVVLRDPHQRGPNLSLNRVSQLRASRGRVHLDFYTHDQAGEVARLLALGARRYPWRYPEGADYVVLEDPEGNLFCVVQVDDAP